MWFALTIWFNTSWLWMWLTIANELCGCHSFCSSRSSIKYLFSRWAERKADEVRMNRFVTWRQNCRAKSNILIITFYPAALDAWVEACRNRKKNVYIIYREWHNWVFMRFIFMWTNLLYEWKCHNGIVLNEIIPIIKWYHSCKCILNDSAMNSSIFSPMIRVFIWLNCDDTKSEWDIY